MTSEDIVEASSKVQAVNIGGMEAMDLVLLAKTITENAENGKTPILFVMPTDLFSTVFDDGEFEANATKFSEIQNRHIQAMFEEYAAWKVLRRDSKKIKK